MDCSQLVPYKSTLKGEFSICDERIKSSLGKKKFTFGAHQWERVMYWNGASMLDADTNTSDVALVLRMASHDNYSVRKQNQHAWMKKIIRAIWTSEGDKAFTDAAYVGPRLHERARPTISLYDLTVIIMEHRNAIMKWQKETNRSVMCCVSIAKAPAPKVPVPSKEEKPQEVEEEPPTKPDQVVIPEYELDDWEDGDW